MTYSAPDCVECEVPPELWSAAAAAVDRADSRVAHDTDACHLDSVLLDVRLVSVESAAAILGRHVDDDEFPILAEVVWESWWCARKFTSSVLYEVRSSEIRAVVHVDDLKLDWFDFAHFLSLTDDSPATGSLPPGAEQALAEQLQCGWADDFIEGLIYGFFSLEDFIGEDNPLIADAARDVLREHDKKFFGALDVGDVQPSRDPKMRELERQSLVALCTEGLSAMELEEGINREQRSTPGLSLLSYLIALTLDADGV